MGRPAVYPPNLSSLGPSPQPPRLLAWINSVNSRCRRAHQTHRVRPTSGGHHAQDRMADTRTDDLVRYINLKLAALGQPTSRFTADPAFLEIRRPATAQLLSERPTAGRPPLPRRRAHSSLPRRLPQRSLSRRSPAPALQHLRSRPHRPRARNVAPARRPKLFRRPI